jgi:hypothetical protein
MSKIANFLAAFLLLAAGAFTNFKGQTTSISDAPTPMTTENTPLTSLEIAEKPINHIAETPKIVTKTATTLKTTSCDRIIIGGNSICLFSASSLNTDAGAKVAVYGGNFYFGHNIPAVFASLHTATSFTIVRNGIATNYKIVQKTIYCDYSNPAYPCSNWPKDPVLNMSQVLQPAKTAKNPTAISLMTCAGTPIGGGDATHRLVAYAIAQ